MKKLIKGFILCCITIVGLSSFTIDKTLKNENYGQTLILYQNGKCVVTGPNLRGTGTYDIQGSNIYIYWDNGVEQQGKYLPNGSANRTARVCVEGVCYDADRAVVRRR